MGNLRVYEIGLIAIRDVSPPFSAAMEYTVNRYRWVPRAGSLKLC